MKAAGLGEVVLLVEQYMETEACESPSSRPALVLQSRTLRQKQTPKTTHPRQLKKLGEGGNWFREEMGRHNGWASERKAKAAAS